MTKTLQKKFIATAMIAITVLIIVLLGTINVINAVRISRENAQVMDMLVMNENMRDKGDFPGGGEAPPDGKKPPESTETPEGMEAPESTEMPEGTEAPEGEVPPESTEVSEGEVPPEEENTEEPVFMPEMFDGRRNPGFFGLKLEEDDMMSARYFLVRLAADESVIFVNVDRISSVDEEEAKVYATRVLEGAQKEGKVDHFKYRVEEGKNGKFIVFLDVSRNTRSILSVLLISVGIGIAAELLMLLLVIALSKKAIKPIAENIDRQKQFVTDAGHEIKTPLSIILANTDAMELHTGESKWSKNIRTQTTRLSGLMKDLLTLARTDEGIVQVNMTDCDMSRVIEETAESFREPASLKEIEIETDIAEGMHMLASKEQMVQLMNLLLDNAVKYSPEKEVISVKAYPAGRGIHIKVSNAYDNLDESTVDKLFDRFYRGDAARTQKGGGYGIGLSVARAICEGHRGTIQASCDRGRITFSAHLAGGKKK